MRYAPPVRLFSPASARLGAVRLTLVSLAGCASSAGPEGACSYACPTHVVPRACVGAASLGIGPACQVDDRLPGRVLSDCCGRLVPLADVICAAHVTVVEFGAGWCVACRESAPILSQWSAKYAARGLRVVSVLKETDTAGSAASQAFCKCWGSDYDASYTLLIDPADVLTTACSGGSLPTTLVVDSNGVVRQRFTGGALDDVEAAFTELLAP